MVLRPSARWPAAATSVLLTASALLPADHVRDVGAWCFALVGVVALARVLTVRVVVDGLGVHHHGFFGCRSTARGDVVDVGTRNSRQTGTPVLHRRDGKPVVLTVLSSPGGGDAAAAEVRHALAATRWQVLATDGP